VALVAQPWRPSAALGPDIGERSFLPDPCFVLKPYFDWLVFGVGW
jgi:hypothetical protein